MSDKRVKSKIKVVIKQKATETRAQIQKSSYVLNFKYVIKYMKHTTNKVNDIFCETEELTIKERKVTNQRAIISKERRKKVSRRLE